MIELKIESDYIWFDWIFTSTLIHLFFSTDVTSIEYRILNFFTSLWEKQRYTVAP